MFRGFIFIKGNLHTLTYFYYERGTINLRVGNLHIRVNGI